MIWFLPIIGRDFVSSYKIDVSVRAEEEKVKIQLFSEIAFVNESALTMNCLYDSFLIPQADRDQVSYKKLLIILQEVEEAEIAPPQHDYLVSIALKDESVFAYAPRRFA